MAKKISSSGTMVLHLSRTRSGALFRIECLDATRLQPDEDQVHLSNKLLDEALELFKRCRVSGELDKFSLTDTPGGYELACHFTADCWWLAICSQVWYDPYIYNLELRPEVIDAIIDFLSEPAATVTTATAPRFGL